MSMWSVTEDFFGSDLSSILTHAMLLIPIEGEQKSAQKNHWRISIRDEFNSHIWSKLQNSGYTPEV